MNYIKNIEKNLDPEKIILKIMNFVLMDLKTIYEKTRYINHVNNKHELYDSSMPFDSVCHLIFSFLEKDIDNNGNKYETTIENLKNLISSLFDNEYLINNYDDYKILITWDDYNTIKNNLEL